MKQGVFALLLVALAAIAADVPYLSGRVVDDAEILSPAARDRLGKALKQHEDKTTNQVVVLTVPTIGGDSIEEYAERLALLEQEHPLPERAQSTLHPMFAGP